MNLKHFYNPASVAVIGASRKKAKVGHEVLSALIHGGYQGKIFPVNPNASTIQGLKSYPDLKSIGEVPDLVVIATAPDLVTTLLQQCVDIKVRAVVVLPFFFERLHGAESHPREVIAGIAESAEIRVLGPNCIGLMSPPTHLNVSYAGDLPGAGEIGYFSKSASILAATLDIAKSKGMGFSRLVCIGDMADVNELDVIESFGEDPETKVIAGYLETFSNGDAFIHLVERIGKRKPILLVKSGVTPAGAKVASSHTGRLTADETAFECVFGRAGVIRCECLRDMLDFAKAFAYQPVPAGPNVAIIANAGGASIIATDAIEREGLKLATLSEQTLAKLSNELENIVNLDNPIEIMSDILAGQFERALRETLDDPGVDTVLMMLTPHATTERIQTVKAIARVKKEKNEKPILACLLGGERVRDAEAILQKARIPCYGSPQKAITTIRVMVNYSRWCSRPKRVVKLFPVNRGKVKRIIERHLKQGKYNVPEIQAKRILEAYGFVTPRGAIATSAEQAAGIADQIGYPVVLKVWSPDIDHKTEVGGVMLGLTNEHSVRDAFDLMMYRIPKIRPDANIPGMLVEEMCTKGQEVILGMSRDPRFGPLMMFGLGGRMVDVLKDVAFYPAPLTAEEAKEMLVSTRTYHHLAGIEGAHAVDIDAIAEGLQRLSQLVTEFPQIKEMDINPFVVGRRGITPIAVDAAMTLEHE
ncbi:MAG: acetate--CoA ligase family protein [bacterium]|nr:MAG: acetate--CoA ligase family protein [bacterium]